MHDGRPRTASLAPRLLARTSLLLATLILCTGCPPRPSPKKFERFHASTITLQSSTDGLFDRAVAWARDGLVEGNELGVPPTFSDMQLEFDDEDVFVASTSYASFYTLIQELQDGVFDLNQALRDYTEALVRLSGGAVEDQARIAKLAGDLNGNLQSAGAALNGVLASQDSPTLTLSSNVTGLASTIAAAALEAYVESQRRQALIRVLGDGQPVVEEHAHLARQAIRVVNADIKNTYSMWAQDLGGQYIAAHREIKRLADTRAGGTDLTPDEIRLLDELLAVQVERRRMLLERNDAVAAAIRSLGQMYASYGKLPAAHANLRESLTEEQGTLDSLTALYDDVRRLEQLYRKLKKAPTD